MSQNREKLLIAYKIKLSSVLEQLELIVHHEPVHPAVISRCIHWLQECQNIIHEYSCLEKVDKPKFEIEKLVDKWKGVQGGNNKSGST